MNVSKNLQTDDLRLFVRCLADGSLTRAARGLGLTQAAASRRIQRLESALGMPILHRTTRALRATADGERLLTTARTVLAELDALERAAGAAREAPTGDVHVSAPVLLGQAIGGALAAELARVHPGLRLRLSLNNARVDLVRSGVDVALRVGSLPDASLLAARLATAHIGAYAQPGRWAKARHPAELAEAPWVGLPGEEARKATGPDGQRWSGRVQLVFVCDDRAILRDAAVAGLGATLLPTFVGDAASTLRRVAPEWHFGRAPLHAVWLPEARHDRRVRAVVEAVTAWSHARAW